MNFTNENPCTYYYINVDDSSFEFDSQFWLDKTIPRRKLQSELIYQSQNDITNRMYNIPVKFTPEEFERKRIAFTYYNTDKFNDNGSPIEISIEDIQTILREKAGLVAPKAFELIEKSHPSGVNRIALTYVAGVSEYEAHAHFHPHILNRNGSHNRDCRTCVVIVPLKHTMPVTEKVFFNHQEIVSREEEEIIEACRKTASPYDKPRGNVVDILMPSPGQYLVVDFLGSRCLHWVENYGTTNEYLCIVAEN